MSLLGGTILPAESWRLLSWCILNGVPAPADATNIRSARPKPLGQHFRNYSPDVNLGCVKQGYSG